jgi:NDP-4-keto-2,6-dideoxyhexose 3-C-methyltransferase
MVSTTERVSCRTCGGGFEDILSLGAHYVSDFPAPGEPDGEPAPLDLVRCLDCSLVQLRHTVSGDRLYRNYWYRSGTNQTMREALADVSRSAAAKVRLNHGDAVLDIGCNDGTLLASYGPNTVFKIGFDPAKNLAQFSSRVANRVVTDFFDGNRYGADSELCRHRPKIITSIAMFYDLEDPHAFVSGIDQILADDGVWVVQMSYLPMMLEQNAFDNICHEHLEYYGLASFDALLRVYDLAVCDVETNDINGGSYRLYVARRSSPLFHDVAAAARVDSMRAREAELRLTEAAPYLEFARRVRALGDETRAFVQEEVAAGKSVYVYGASTKGNTLLQYYGLDRRWITAAAERNPDKWGRETVGTRIPIVSEADARAARPDYFIVLPWHFLPEFIDREKEHLSSGGRFIVPLPAFRIVGAE